ncbi:subtilisin-like protein [Lactarius sanguifluus]|nr:subtilisin-like protein [Lactarius sanguifluus]
MHYHWLDHWTSLLSILLTVPIGSLTTLSPWDGMRTTHSWNTLPSMWEVLGSPPAGTTIDLCVALEPQRENALIEALHEVSDPTHPKYGAHLSREQVGELVAPGPDTLELVHSWLGHHCVPSESVSVTHGGSSLTLTGVPISHANSLLGASYQLYRHVETNETIIRTIGYSLPATLHAHVRIVAPTTRWRAPLKHSESEEPMTVLSNRDASDETTSSTWGYTPTSTDQNSLGIVGYNGQYPSPWDLGTFMDKYRNLHRRRSQWRVIRREQEPNLDVQYAEAMAYPTPHTFYGTGREPQEDPHLSWLNYILEQENIPQTISISHGNEEKNYSTDDAIYACRLFGQLGLRDCKAKDGSVRFSLMFPATCPFVTSVGGATRGGFLPEVAASFSGGGFSYLFSRPSYQQQAVSTYLQNLGNQHQGMYKCARFRLKFPIIINGNVRLVSGTSASTPVPARLLNPWLYGGGLSSLNDITSGSNPVCNTGGFPAIVGWDPVTGLGTPDFERLLESLPVVPNPTS